MMWLCHPDYIVTRSDFTPCCYVFFFCLYRTTCILTGWVVGKCTYIGNVHVAYSVHTWLKFCQELKFFPSQCDPWSRSEATCFIRSSAYWVHRIYQQRFLFVVLLFFFVLTIVWFTHSYLPVSVKFFALFACVARRRRSPVHLPVLWCSSRRLTGRKQSINSPNPRYFTSIWC